MRTPSLLDLAVSSFRARCVLVFLLFSFGAHFVGADELFDARGFVQNRAYFGQAPLEHVDPATGSLILTFTDLVLPGNAGFDLRIQRTYNSKVYRNWEALGNTLNEDSWAGVGWTLHLGRILQPGSARPVIEMPDGSRHATFTNPTRTGCLITGSTCLITKDFWIYEPPYVRLPDGVVYQMDHEGNVGDVNGLALYTTQITDPFGNHVSVAYMAAGTDPSLPADGIATITQDLGNGQTRTIEFTTSTNVNTTPSGTVPLQDLNSMVLKVNNVEKARWTYNQTAVNGGFTLLNEVIPPEGNSFTTWKYEYTSGTPDGLDNLLSKATTPYLGEFTYSYVEATLFSGTTVGVRTPVVYFRNFWDFFNNSSMEYRYPGLAYGDGFVPPSDTRYVIGPCSTTTYTYWGLGTNNDGVPAWKVGAVRTKQVSEGPGKAVVEQDDTEYEDPPLAQISSDPETVGNQTTVGIYLALVKRRTITRFDANGSNGKVYVTDYGYNPDNLNDFGRPTTITETGELTRTTSRSYRYGFTPYLIDRPASETVTIGTESFTKSFDYDLTNGFKTSQTIYGVPTTYTPTSQGDVATITDANGHTTRMTYDWALVKEVFTPEYTPATVTRVINPEGTVASETRYQNGTPFLTSFDYDRMFRVKRTDPAVGDPVMTTYDVVLDASQTTAPHRIATVTTRGATSLTEVHDGAGRVELRYNALLEQSAVGYDACGRVSYQSDPFRGDVDNPNDNVGTRFEYDVLGRATKKTNTADGTFATYAYHDGVDVDITDEEHHTMKQDWSAFGDPKDARLMAVTDADNKQTSYGYNALGSLTSATVQGVPTRSWVYNTKGQLASETHPESGTASYTYDAAGNMIARSDARFGDALPARYCHDGNNRLVRVSLAGTASDSSCTPADETFTYDESDNRLTATRGADSRSFEYDGANRLRRQIQTTSNRVFSMTYDYDGEDNLHTLGYPLFSSQPDSARHVARFEHDAANRVSDVFWSSGGPETQIAGSMTYHPSGGLAGYNWGNGLAQHTTVQYDKRSRPTSIVAGSFLSLGYDAYDNVNNIKNISDGRGTAYGQTFRYDALDRLNSASGIWGSGTLSYDAAGNRLSSSLSGNVTYNYDGATQRLASTTGIPQTFGYDPNGNTTSDGSGTYTYTPDNMLETATIGGRITSYAYDSEQGRTLKGAIDGAHFYFRDHAGQVVSEMRSVAGADPTVIHEYVFAGQRLLAAVRPDGIRATPTSLLFSAVQNGAVSAPQTVTIVSESAAALTWHAAISPLTPWLVISSHDGSTPFALSVSVDSAQVGGPGTYDGTITITAQDGAGNAVAGSPVTIDVQVVVSASTDLSATPGSLSFTMTAGGGNPPPQAIAITLVGSPATWQATAADPWVVLSSASGQTPGSLLVSINGLGFGSGTYQSSVTITATGVTGSPIVIPLTLEVPARLGTCAADALYCEPFEDLDTGALNGQKGWQVLAGRRSGQVTADPRGVGRILLLDAPAGGVSGDILNVVNAPLDGLEFSIQVMSQDVDPSSKQVAKIEFMTEEGVAWGKTHRTFGAIRWGSVLYVQYGPNIYYRLLDSMESGRWYDVRVRYQDGGITAYVDGAPLFNTSNPLTGTHPFQTFATSAWDFPGSASLDLLQVRPANGVQEPALSVTPQILNFTATAGVASLATPSRVRYASNAVAPQPAQARTAPTRAAQTRMHSALAFEPNVGQADPSVRYVARGKGYSLLALPDGLVLGLTHTKPGAQQPTPGPRRSPLPEVETDRITMRLQGASSAPSMQTADLLKSYSNYFIGSDPKAWRTHVPQYSRVTYDDVYPGVDLALYGRDGQLEYDLVVKPGADPSQIHMAFEGVDRVQVADGGDLVLSTPHGELRQIRPVVYQELDGRRRELAGRYVVSSGNQVAVKVDDYDRRLALTIDPVLIYSTYLGGSGQDLAEGVAVDVSGRPYVVGISGSSDFPVFGPNSSGPFGARGSFVTRFAADGSTPEFSTFFTVVNNTSANAIALDSAGDIYITGTVQAGSNPAHVYVRKMSKDGDRQIFDAYFGGSGQDMPFGIAVDGQGNSYVSGQTFSTDLPVNGFQPAFAGGAQTDGFIVKFDASGHVAGATYLGGTADEEIPGIALDPQGHVYVAGHTRSADFPTLNPFQAALSGPSDGFVAKLTPDLMALEYSTYLGGTSDDSISSIAVDSTGHAYVTGGTYSADFPTLNPIVATRKAAKNPFVTKLEPDGAHLTFSTYLGGSGRDNAGEAFGIALDGFENVYSTGIMFAADFPLVDAFQTIIGADHYDAYVTKIDSSGTSLLYSSFLGGRLQDSPSLGGIAVDDAGNAFVVGSTKSPDFPLANAFDSTYGGGPLSNTEDVFLTKIGPASNAPPGTLQLSAATYSVTEGQGSVTLTIKRVGGSRGDVSVDVDTTPGTAVANVDYTPVSSTVFLADGQTVGTFSIPIVNDNIFEPAETFTVTLSNPTAGAVLGTPSSATVTINDDDTAGDRLVQTFTVSDFNNPTGPPWQAIVDVPWLTLDQYSGVGPSTVTATANPAGLAVGTYTGTVTVTAPAAGSPRTVQVNLTVGPPPPTTLTPTADAHVRDGSSASTNFGTATTMEVRTSTTGNNRDTYLKFDLNGMPSVSNAKLRIFAALSASGSISTSVYPVATTTWTETGITWNNKPARGTALASTTINSTTFAWKEIDVTSYVQGEFAAGRKIVSFALHDTATTTPNVNVKSREVPATPPQLVVTQ